MEPLESGAQSREVCHWGNEFEDYTCFPVSSNPLHAPGMWEASNFTHSKAIMLFHNGWESMGTDCGLTALKLWAQSHLSLLEVISVSYLPPENWLTHWASALHSASLLLGVKCCLLSLQWESGGSKGEMPCLSLPRWGTVKLKLVNPDVYSWHSSIWQLQSYEWELIHLLWKNPHLNLP